MRMRAAICLLVTVAACAGGGGDRPSASTGPATIVARVVASRQMSVVSAATAGFDVTFEERTAHRLAPRDPRSASFTALATSADCPAGGPGQWYELSFVRRPIAFGITDALDRQWTTNLEIASCRPVAAG